MPIVFVCNGCGQKVSAVLVRGAEFVVKRYWIRRDKGISYKCVADAVETALPEECPFCGRKLSKKPIDVVVRAVRRGR